MRLHENPLIPLLQATPVTFPMLAPFEGTQTADCVIITERAQSFGDLCQQSRSEVLRTFVGIRTLVPASWSPRSCLQEASWWAAL